MEWLDFSGTSLGFNPGPLGNSASASHPGPVAPPNSLASQSLQAPPLDAHFQTDGPEASQNSRQQPHSRADSSADPECEWKTGLTLLQGLVFDLRRDVDDLGSAWRFWTQGFSIPAFSLSNAG
jgi:hypothetical protein